MNGMSPIERELLTMLAEEAAEVVQAVTKILRHGPDNYNPDAEVRVLNTSALRKEIIDLVAVVQIMRESDKPILNFITFHPTPIELGDAMRRKQRYMHRSLNEDSKED